MSAQHNDHVWLNVHNENWAIHAVIGPIIVLWRGYDPDLEWSAIDISEMDWTAYVEAAVALLTRVN